MTARIPLRLAPAPNWDAPYVDRREPHTDPARSLQGTLALDFPLASGLPVRPEPFPRLRLVADPDDADFGPVPTPRSALPPARAWTARLAQAIAEVAAGDRPVQQLIRWTSPEVYNALAEPASPGTKPKHGAARTRSVVRSLRVTEPADGVIEASAVVVGAGRPAALALRMEGLDGRWICTVLERVGQPL